mgnify:CR=1 FL=1
MDQVTKKDLEELTKNITKVIRSESSKLDKKLTTQSKQIDRRFEFQSELLEQHLETQLEETLKTLRSDNLNFKDEIISEIVTLRQETSVNSSHRLLLTDHEQRISKVEKHLFSN